MEEQAPAGGDGVEGFVQALKADLSSPKPADDGDQVLDRATEPVQGRDDEGVPGAQLIQRGPQLLALRVLAGLLVGEGPRTSGSVQGSDHLIEQLALGGYPGVSDPGAGCGREECRQGRRKTWCAGPAEPGNVFVMFFQTPIYE
ncbi:hypothetical protein XF35_09285 [Streptomyces platensis subsp. clarensis]|nr:hypothetical protein [Streptomyces platensis subsp. clarensis]